MPYVDLGPVVGADGAPGATGKTGATGSQGRPGQSAYELAKAAGFVGTEAEWLASLKGDPGHIGPQGPAGKDGLNRRTARFVVGTSTAGWTADDCDYLCDGTDDDEEIQAALSALPENGGKVVLLDGVYYCTSSVFLSKRGTTLQGSGYSTVLDLGSGNELGLQGAQSTIQDMKVLGSVDADASPADITILGEAQTLRNLWVSFVRISDYGIEGRHARLFNSYITTAGKPLRITGPNFLAIGNVFEAGGSDNFVDSLGTFQSSGGLFANNIIIGFTDLPDGTVSSGQAPTFANNVIV